MSAIESGREEGFLGVVLESMRNDGLIWNERRSGKLPAKNAITGIFLLRADSLRDSRTPVYTRSAKLARSGEPQVLAKRPLARQKDEDGEQEERRSPELRLGGLPNDLARK